MAKGRLVTEAVEILIASVYDENPQWTAAKVQRMVSALLREHNPDLPRDWPGLNSVQKVLAALRKKRKESEEGPRGKPWSIGVSAKHGIAPHAIPLILRVWELWEHRGLSTHGRRSASRPSIREARWVSRLCHVIPDDVEALGQAASVYAKVEEFSERLGHPVFDSTALDYGFMESSRPLPFDMRAAVEHVRSQVTESGYSRQQEAMNSEE